MHGRKTRKRELNKIRLISLLIERQPCTLNTRKVNIKNVHVQRTSVGLIFRITSVFLYFFTASKIMFPKLKREYDHLLHILCQHFSRVLSKNIFCTFVILQNNSARSISWGTPT